MPLIVSRDKLYTKTTYEMRCFQGSQELFFLLRSHKLFCNKSINTALRAWKEWICFVLVEETSLARKLCDYRCFYVFMSAYLQHRQLGPQTLFCSLSFILKNGLYLYPQLSAKLHRATVLRVALSVSIVCIFP